MRRAKLKAFGVAVLSLFRKVEINKRGHAWVEGWSFRLFKMLSLFYDVRRTRSGRMWIQLRERK